MEKIGFRIKIIVAAVILVWAILFIRIYAIAIKNNDYYRELAQKNIIKKIITAPFRGNIKDRNGNLVALNKLGFSVSLDPYLKSSDLESRVAMFAKFFPEIDPESIIALYKKKRSAYNHDPIEVIPFVDYTKMQEIYPYLSQNDDVIIAPASKRHYPYGESASHVIGYIGASDERDITNNIVSKYTGTVGRTGLEKEYNSYLQGDVGLEVAIVDSRNRVIDVQSQKDSVSQKDLTITLDMRLQEVANRAFAKMQKNGAVVVMDSQTGEVLVAGSYPEYDLNEFVGGISHTKWNALQQDLANPLLNKLVNGVYAPGSVVKMGVALSFLEYAGINEHTLIDTPGFIELGGRKFRDWKTQGHGKTDLIKAIRESVDVYFYRLSQQAGMNNISKVLSGMGFGQKTGVDLPNEFLGILPNPEWKMSKGLVWYLGDTVVTSIGQGSFLVTPMQVARYTALMASSMLPTPHFRKNDTKDFAPKDVLSPFQKSKLKYIQEGMREACSVPTGTAFRVMRHIQVTIGCKTGTAQVVSIPQNIKVRIKESDLPYYHRSHAWITGFVPFKNPRYVITVFMEHGEAGGNAGPIMVELANALKAYGYIK